MCKSYVGYLRVSTARRGRSGFGLEAQEAAIAAFIVSKGDDAKLLASFTEVESGKRDDRPELARAIEHARLTGATLLIAKFGRLSRDTKDALRAAKARRVGRPNSAEHLRGRGFNLLATAALEAGADERAKGLAATIEALKAEGFTSANSIAGALNSRGYPTPRGGRWRARSVINLLKRLHRLSRA